MLSLCMLIWEVTDGYVGPNGSKTVNFQLHLQPVFYTGSFLWIAMKSWLAGPLESLLSMSHSRHKDSRCLQYWICPLPGFWWYEVRLLDLHGKQYYPLLNQILIPPPYYLTYWALYYCWFFKMSISLLNFIFKSSFVFLTYASVYLYSLRLHRNVL